MVAFSPITIESIDMLESVQRRFTKYLPGLFDLSYTDRMLNLGLKTLEERRIVFDLVFLFKLVTGRIGIAFDDFFSYGYCLTRGHQYKILVSKYRLDCRKYFFCNRVISAWNELPENIPSSPTVVEFRDSLSEVDLSKYCRGTYFK